MRHTVDEIRERDQSRGNSDYGAVESSDEDLRVRVESLGCVQIVRYCLSQAVSPEIGAWGRLAID